MNDYLKHKYIDEARDLVEELESSLLVLEESPGNPEIINRIFRALHSLKGSGSMFGFDLISEFTHALETVYEEIRSRRLQLSSALLNQTLRSVDIIRQLLVQGADPDPALVVQTRELKDKIIDLSGISQPKPMGTLFPEMQEDPEDQTEKLFDIRFEPGPDILKTGNNPFYMLDELSTLGETRIEWIHSAIPPLESLDVHRCYAAWNIRIRTQHSENILREVFLFIEEESTLLIRRAEIPEPVPEPLPSPDQPETGQAPVQGPDTAPAATIRVSSGKLDQLMNLVSELVTLQARLDLLADQMGSHEIINLAESLHKLSRQLRDTTFDICMVPLQSIVTRFQRLVRDLSADTGKNVRFVTEGADTELDKTIIETITEPILHIIRNSMDHGIEMPAERQRRGKSELPLIKLRAFYQGPNVCIEISDDGAGINRKKVLERAFTNGLLQAGREYPDKEIYDVLFKPGFSTADSVSALSGRGVGLDVVRQKITSVRGEVSIDSKEGVGTSFMLKLPLTLSIIDGLLVDIAGERFILPLEFVRKIVVCPRHEIESAYKGLITVDERKIPFFHLRKEFSHSGEIPEKSELILVNYAGKEVGLAVDSIVGEYQVVIKPLGKVFHTLNMFSGAAVLGDGGLALVFDLHRMISELSGSPDTVIA